MGGNLSSHLLHCSSYDVKLGESTIDIVDEVLVWGILGLVIVFLLGIALPAFLRFFLFPEKPDEESGLKKHGFPTMSKSDDNKNTDCD